MKYWVDPPHGDQYGFPKVWDKSAQHDWEKWIVSQGYPSCLLNKITSVQMWPAKGPHVSTCGLTRSGQRA